MAGVGTRRERTMRAVKAWREVKYSRPLARRSLTPRAHATREGYRFKYLFPPTPFAYSPPPFPPSHWTQSAADHAATRPSSLPRAGQGHVGVNTPLSTGSRPANSQCPLERLEANQSKLSRDISWCGDEGWSSFQYTLRRAPLAQRVPPLPSPTSQRIRSSTALQLQRPRHLMARHATAGEQRSVTNRL